MVCKNCGSDGHRKNNRKCTNYSSYLKELGERRSQKKDENDLMDEEDQNTSKKRQHETENTDSPAKKPSSVCERKLRSLSSTYLTTKIPRTSADSWSSDNEEENSKKDNSSGIKLKSPEMLQIGETEKQGVQMEKESESWNDYLDRMHEVNMKKLAENRDPAEDEWYMKFLNDTGKNIENDDPVEHEWYMKFLDKK